MEKLFTVFIFSLFAIGAVVIGIPILLIGTLLWWITIPLLGLWLGGWFGFFVGIGLCVTIFVIYAVISESSKTTLAGNDALDEKNRGEVREIVLKTKSHRLPTDSQLREKVLEQLIDEEIRNRKSRADSGSN